MGCIEICTDSRVKGRLSPGGAEPQLAIHFYNLNQKGKSAMKEWEKGEVSHCLHAGIFELHVNPTDGDGPFQAWVVIPKDGGSSVLPKVNDMPTVEKAKRAIETRFVSMMRAGISAVSRDG